MRSSISSRTSELVQGVLVGTSEGSWSFESPVQPLAHAGECTGH